MDISGIIEGSTAQRLQNVQVAAATKVLSKTMNADEQVMDTLLGGMDAETSANAAAMELSVNPLIGSMFDARI